jgi:hypothetical protein
MSSKHHRLFAISGERPDEHDTHLKCVPRLNETIAVFPQGPSWVVALIPSPAAETRSFSVSPPRRRYHSDTGPPSAAVCGVQGSGLRSAVVMFQGFVNASTSSLRDCVCEKVVAVVSAHVADVHRPAQRSRRTSTATAWMRFGRT